MPLTNVEVTKKANFGLSFIAPNNTEIVGLNADFGKNAGAGIFTDAGGSGNLFAIASGLYTISFDVETVIRVANGSSPAATRFMTMRTIISGFNPGIISLTPTKTYSYSNNNFQIINKINFNFMREMEAGNAITPLVTQSLSTPNIAIDLNVTIIRIELI